MDENHAALMLKDVPAHEREAAIDGDDVEEAEGEEDADEDASQSGDETDGESQDEAGEEDADEDASQSGNETDDESQDEASDDEARGAAEALLGVSLSSLQIMRIEAQRARDVVDGKKTLELTKGRCNRRGLVLIGEKAKGAIAKGCVIGAVTLGECNRMSREDFETTGDRHLASDFAPAQAWLENGQMHAQELSSAVRFEMPVRYPPQLGPQKWLSYSPQHALRRAVLRRLQTVRQRIEGCRCISTLRRAHVMVRQLETIMAEMDGASSGGHEGQLGSERGSSIDGHEAEGGDERGETNF